MDLVFAALVEPAQAIEALKTCSGIGGVGVNRHRAQRDYVAVHDLELRRISVLDTRELEEVAEAKSIAVHLHARHRRQQRDVFRLEQIGASDEHSAGPIE